MRVHCRSEPDEPHLTTLRAAVPTIGFGVPVPDGIDVLVTGRPSEEELACVRDGGALVIPFAGLPQATRELALRRPDLAVYNLHHNAGLVAEHAVGMLLAVARRLVPAHAAMARGDWRIRYADDPSVGLDGARAVILGHGAIGRRIGAALGALGMEVVGIRRTVPPTLADLDGLLPTTTALIVALPHTPETEGLLGATRLARLPPSAMVINVGRGAVIDEDALYAALAERRLFGAGLDVWWQYPPTEKARATTWPRRPFHELDNVLLSPHRAAHGRRTDALRYEQLAELLAELVAGRPPATRVDLVAGY